MKISNVGIRTQILSSPNITFGADGRANPEIEKFLKEQKINGKRRFTDEEIKNISNQIELNRKKYKIRRNDNRPFLEALKMLMSFKKASQKGRKLYLSSEDIAALLSTKSCIKEGYVINHSFLDYFGLREGLSGKDIIKIRDAAEGHEFCGYAIQAMLTANDNKGQLIYSIDDICELLKHADIKTGTHGLYDLIKTRIYDDKLSEKRFMTKDELIKILSENREGFSIRTSPSGIRLAHQGNVKNYELTPNGIEQISSEKHIIDNNTKTVRNKRIFADGRQNFCVMGFGNHVFQNSFTAVYDKENNRLYYEQLRPYKMHPDIFLLNKLTDNKEEKLAYIEKTPNGYIYRKNFVSPNGLKTNQIITENENEQTSVYTIRDSSDKVLFNQERKFKRVDDNHTQSWLNGQKYDMKFFDNKIEITKEDKETVVLGRRQLNMRLLGLYKKLPGDVLSLIHKLGIKVQPAKTVEDCLYNEIDKIIQTVNDAGIFMHEFGHATDDMLLLKQSEFRQQLAKVYRKEFSDISRNTNDLTIGSLDKFEKLHELIAEGYQILSGHFTSARYVKDLGIRTINMQRYFPKSMSILAKQFLKLRII